jgi:hypothetical protein
MYTALRRGARAGLVGLQDPAHALMLLHPALDPIDGIGELLLQLPHLLRDPGRRQRPESDQAADHRGDQDQGTDRARYASLLQVGHNPRERDPEQHAEEGQHEDRARGPEELEREPETHDQRGGAQDVAGAPPDGLHVVVGRIRWGGGRRGRWRRWHPQ